METKTHWRKTDNPNYLGAYAFQDGEEKALTICEVKTEKVMNPEMLTEEDKLVIHFKEGEKPLILNTTNKRMIAKVVESPYLEDWPNHGIILCVQRVKAFGELVEAVRIRPIKPFICSDCGNVITGFENMLHSEVKDYTVKKYGRQLCNKCAAAEKQKREG